MPTRLTLVRHGAPESGPVDPGLSARGRDQAMRAAEVLAFEAVDAVVTSPLRRARETAEPIAGAHRHVPEIRDVLQEWGSAEINAEPYTALDELTDLQAAINRGSFGRIAPPGVDLGALRDTLLDVALEIAAAHRGGHVVITFHGGNINVLVGALLGIPRPLWFLPDYASITRVAYLPSGRWVVHSVNETTHLLADGLL